MQSRQVLLLLLPNVCCVAERERNFLCTIATRASNCCIWASKSNCMLWESVKHILNRLVCGPAQSSEGIQEVYKALKLVNHSSWSS